MAGHNVPNRTGPPPASRVVWATRVLARSVRSAHDPPPTGHDRTVRLATFNILNGRSQQDDRVDLDRFADAIASLDADVLALYGHCLLDVFGHDVFLQAGTPSDAPSRADDQFLF